jgi:hypothetical protein
MGGRLPPEILDPVREAISGYPIIGPGERVMIAFSGGKDSLLLGLILTELKIPVFCVSIDMGYEDGWGERIRELAGAAGLSIEVVSPRRSDSSVLGHDRIRRNLRVLDLLPADAPGTITPCTHCYDVKALTLQDVARRHGVRSVAFGHHQTDATASLLKEALMHVDRWDRGHEVFRRENFAALVEELRAESQDASAGAAKPLLGRITRLVQEGMIDTDEPPIQPLNANDPDIRLVRPMFLLDESEIIRVIRNLALGTEGSGCGHGISGTYLTPREMVHYRVVRNAAGSWFKDHMRDLVLQGINTDGTARFRARRNRAALLGGRYKPTASGLDKS